MSHSNITNLGSNQVDEDFDRDEKKFYPSIESCTFRNGKGGEREAAELTGGGIAFLEKSERELIAKLIEYYEAGMGNLAYRMVKYEALCDVPESVFNKLRESIK